MKRSVHTESEMVKAVQEFESGIDAETVARNHGISKATLYNWKSKYSVQWYGSKPGKAFEGT